LTSASYSSEISEDISRQFFFMKPSMFFNSDSNDQIPIADMVTHLSHAQIDFPLHISSFGTAILPGGREYHRLNTFPNESNGLI
jgi:hypothetical protein